MGGGAVSMAMESLDDGMIVVLRFWLALYSMRDANACVIVAFRVILDLDLIQNPALAMMAPAWQSKKGGGGRNLRNLVLTATTFS
jgi:hypothetical protein